MQPQDRAAQPSSEGPDDASPEASGHLWPGPEYQRQVEQLRAAIGQPIYLAELDATAVQLGVRITDRAYTLLGIVDFPRPDPSAGLAPHLLILDDGRGVNLGRIARVSVGHAFSPAPAEILFQDRAALRTLLFRDRQLSREWIAQRSRQLLGALLGPRVPSAELPGTEPKATLDPPGET